MSEKKKPSKHKKWIACPIEDEYFGDDRKLSRAERKMASSNDRSKYKKTDQDKIKAVKISAKDRERLLRGRVLSISSQGFIVEHEQKSYACSLRGSLKKEKSRAKNLVAVGDFVLFEPLEDDEGSIIHVDERHSVLSRADNLHRRKEQILAANIDQVLITVSVVNPPLKPALVDRYIIASRIGKMDPIIIINKIDLLDKDPEQKELYHEFLKAWRSADVPIISVSAETGVGLKELQEVMHNKASVFSGQSGTGKSSLINAMTHHDLKVGDVIEKTRKGSHTTTQTQLLPLEFGGWVIDTPGIKSFGVWDLKKDQVESYFSQIHEVGEKCHFPNCSHSHENQCAVIDAVEKGEISRLRYDSYRVLISSLDEKYKPR